MDLASMARVTKLSIDLLEDKAKTTPVFAPGLDNLVSVGGVAEVWDPQRSLADQLATLLAARRDHDARATLGAERQGRPKAAAIAGEVDMAARR